MDIPESFRARANRPPDPPLEHVRKFLGRYFAGADTFDEVRAELAELAAVSPDGVRGHIAAIEALLTDPPAEGVLARLVGWEGNWVLDDPSDAGAACWLRQIAELMRGLLASSPPRRSGGTA